MVKTLLKFFPVILILLLFAAKIQAQSWLPLGPDDFNQPSFGPVTFTKIATDIAGISYVAYEDINNGGKITVRKFVGNSWVPVGAPGFSAGQATYISLAINGSTPYVAYQDYANGSKAIVKKFNGTNWVTVGVEGVSIGQAYDNTLAFDGNSPYIAYFDTYNVNSRIAVVKKFDGNAWVTVGSTISSGFVGDISLAINDNTPYVFYSDYNNGNGIVKRFNGTNWVVVGSTGFIASYVSNLNLAFIGNTPYVAYGDVNNEFKATVKKFDGSSWMLVGAAGFSADNAGYLKFATDGSIPYVSYSDIANGYKATVMKFDGNSWVALGVPGGFSADQADQPILAFSNTTPYIIYGDDSKNGKATVKKFDGSSWLPVGINFGLTGTQSYISFISLKANNNQPYLAYSDGKYGAKASMNTFDGTGWVPVGTPGFSPGPVGYVSTDFYSNTPYVAYTDFTNYNNGKATVKKFDGTDWLTVGNPNFSAGSVFYNSLKVNGSVPYLAYSDGANNLKATVKKFDGTNWVTVGAAGFSASQANYTSLAFNVDTPYVIYADGVYSLYNGYNGYNGGRTTVKKFDGSSWVTVGTPGFSAGPVNNTTLIFDGNTLYAAYQEANFDGNIIVKKFDGTSWINVATPIRSSSTSSSFSITLIKKELYIIYQDPNAAGKATVKKLSGGSWVTVGVEGFSASTATNPQIASSDNKIYVVYNSDGLTFSKYFDLPIVNNALLANLAIITGTISPAFTPDSTTYKLNVNNSTSNLILTPTAGDANATITVNGLAVASGAASAAIPLNTGFNTIKTVVTTQDGTTQKTYTITVNRAKASQIIAFAALPAKTYGDTSFSFGAVSDNATIPVTYTSSNSKIISVDASGKAHIFSAGTATITASQTADTSYLAATPVTQILTVNKASLSITANNQTKIYGTANPALTVSYSGFVNGDTQDNLTTKPTITTTATAGSATGTYPITATDAASDNYNITYQPGTLTVVPGSQTLTFASLPAKIYGDADFTLTTTASSGLAAAFTSSNAAVATVDAAGTVHILSAGKTTITANQSGDANYTAATPITQILTVNKALITITANNQTKIYGSGNPALTFVYAGFLNGEMSSVLTTAPAISTTATTTSDAGTYPIIISGADAANYSFTYVPGTLNITKAPQTITFVSVPAKVFGDADFNPGAVSSSGLPIIYTSSNLNVFTTVNGKLHVAGAGTATITASQPGNINYFPAAAVTQDLQVIFTLPSNNFTISATGESCKNSSTGEINITALNNLSYTATIASATTSTAYPFTGKLSVKNLPAGTYSVCITIAAYPAFKQCFDVTVTAPKDLSVYSVVDPASATLSLNLSGSSLYNINLNGASFSTTKSEISLPLATGKNTLSITTANICQGVFEKTIELPVSITAYPNPFDNRLSLSLANNHSQAATAQVYNMQGRLVYSGKTSVNQGICSFDLSTLSAGSYVLKLVLDQSETNIKIIKR